jgi:hypothetical protein
MKHFILITLALVSLASAADKPAHLFILTGQSNMAGMDPKLGFEPEAKKLSQTPMWPTSRSRREVSRSVTG